MNTPFKAANIILHVALISIFIIILFFTYGLYLEKIIVEHQLKYVFNKNTKSLFVSINSGNKLKTLS